MTLLFFLLLTFIQFVIGYSLLCLLRMQEHSIRAIALSLITGIAIVSVIPFLLQMLYIPLTYFSVFSAIGVVAIVLVLPARKEVVKFRVKLPAIKIYEMPWLIAIGLLVAFATYCCYLLPPTARDLLGGPEPIAAFALTEHTFINSVFQQDMPMNNGPFKSLFIPSLQLIYKMVGFTFGKMWLATLNISFIIFLYSLIRNAIHPVLAGISMMFFFFAPEMYAYMYLVLYDYSNMIFFFVSLYYLKEYLFKKEAKNLILSVIFIAVATYIRPETLILSAIIFAFAIVYKLIQKKLTTKTAISLSLLFVTSGVMYFVSSYLYLNYYLPVLYDVEETVNSNLFDLSPLFTRLEDMTTVLIYSDRGVQYFGYIFYVHIALIAAELTIYRKLTKSGAYWLTLFFVIFIGIAFIGYLLPLADLYNTTKRALFKLMPLMIMYWSCNRVVLNLSARLSGSGGSGKKVKAA